MKQNRNRISAVLAVLLGTGLLTGCGDTQTQAADTRSMVAEQTAAASDTDKRGDLNGDGVQDVTDAQLLMQYYVANTLANKKLTWDALLSGLPAADPAETDKAAAAETIQSLMEAMTAGDGEKIFKYSGSGDLMRLMTGSTKTDEEILNDPSFTVNKIESYTLGEVKEDAEALAEYQRLYEQSTADARNAFANKNSEASELRMAYLVMTLLKPVTKMYSCHVSMTSEGKTNEADLLIPCDENGEWRVDFGVQAALTSYLALSKKEAAGSAANNLSKALTSALVDFDEQGIDVSVLDGDYTLSGSDFKNLGAVSYSVSAITKEEALALLKIRVRSYYSAVSELESVSFRLKDGCCVAAAAEKRFGDETFIGSYPKLADIPEDMNVTQVMQKAAELNS